MNTRNKTTQTPWRLPRLAATGVICLLVSVNTRADAVSTLLAPQPQAAVRPAPPTANITRDMQVLSRRDEMLYRAIFASQAKGDWKAADAVIAELKNKGLMGHVLADRYLRGNPSANELKAWLAAYSRLPEAGDIYDEARDLPASKGARFAKPDSNNIWGGGESYEASFGFRTDTVNDRHTTPAMRKFFAKVDRKLRHGDPYGAEDAMYAELERRAIPSDELAGIQGRIAAGFFYAGGMEQARELSGQALASGNPLALWIAGLSAWKQKDVHAAANDFIRLASAKGISASDKSAAAFWAWRALTRAGDAAQAKTMLAEAAQQPRTFYGLMAASLLSNESLWSWDLPAADDRDLDALQQNPAGWRALALIQIGQTELAESELRHLNPQGRRDLQTAMLTLAESDHMPSLELQVGSVATDEDGRRYDAALYPVPPWQPEQGFQVDRALLYALMRRESSFDPTAVSGRGACGLMQLMPKTADHVAKQKISAGKEDCSDRMLDPDYNLALGQEYVRQLSRQPMIGDNLLFLLAAYNGGPGKLAHWTDEQTAEDPLLFVESLPLHETRNYIQQVLMHYWTYRARLDESVASIAQLAKGQWPRYALRDETLPKTRKVASATDFEVASSVK